MGQGSSRVLFVCLCFFQGRDLKRGEVEGRDWAGDKNSRGEETGAGPF